MYFRTLVLFQIFFSYYVAVNSKKARKPLPFIQIAPAAKYNNPDSIKDRIHDRNMSKPQMPVMWLEQYRQPYDPAWMDYCDKIHCADYYRNVCGLNRNTMRFKMFQSVCHLSLNNQCSYHLGLLKYDIVNTKFCYIYTMQLRSGCERPCGRAVAPVCARAGRRAVLFNNRCSLDKANCGALFDKFEEVDMSVCIYYGSKAIEE